MEKYIGKEQALMQLTGRFPKDMSLEKYIGLVNFRINELATTDVIPIPEGATNGDMFLKSHPEVVATIIKKEGCLFDCVQLRNKEETIPFAEVYIDWWNAPYKREVEE